MEPKIRARFTDSILHDALQRFGSTPEHAQALDGFESYIYEFERDGEAYILRIGHSLRRTVNLIQGEVAWINFLAEGGAGVARAILSEHGALVECLDDGQGGQFLATAFVKAPGGPAGVTGGWNPARNERYGALLGRIHALSKQYTLPNPAYERPQWDDPLNLGEMRWMPAHETHAIAQFQAVVDHLTALPRDRESYGLIHQDAHGGNLFITADDVITLFDFDDCIYSWFVYDIAMVIFYRLVLEADPVAAADAFWPHFWRGYCQENTLDPAWLAEIPHFLKLREIDLLAVLYRSFGTVDAITPDDDWWAAQFVPGRRARINQDLPVIPYDFAAVVR